MSQVDRTGTFRCQPLEWGVAESSQAKLPQFLAKAYLTEFYDEETGVWVDWTEYGMEINLYAILYGKIKGGKEIGPTLNHQQVMKVFSWDGRSFFDLANGDYSQLRFQVRIEENTYEGAKTPFQVTWIDVNDADPIRQLRKLDAEEVKALDQKYASLLKQSGKAVKAVSAKPSVPATKPSVPTATKPVVPQRPVEPPIPDTKPVETPTAKKQRLAAKAERNRKAEAAETARQAALKTEAAEEPDLSSPPERTTKVSARQEAWETIVELRSDDVTDEQLGEVWNATIEEVAGDVPSENITDGQWKTIRDKVLDQVGKF